MDLSFSSHDKSESTHLYYNMNHCLPWHLLQSFFTLISKYIYLCIDTEHVCQIHFRSTPNYQTFVSQWRNEYSNNNTCSPLTLSPSCKYQHLGKSWYLHRSFVRDSPWIGAAEIKESWQTTALKSVFYVPGGFICN